MTVTSIAAHPRFSEVERPVHINDLNLGYGRSQIYAFIAEGMPVEGRDARGRQLVLRSKAQAWLNSRNMGRGYATQPKRRENG